MNPRAPRWMPAVLSGGSAVLGICYGQQLMAYLLGGGVRKGDKGEYGFATPRHHGFRADLSVRSKVRSRSG